MIGELLIVFALLEVYKYIRSLANTRYDQALENGLAILDFERHLRLDFELQMNQWLTEHQLLSRIATEVYQHTHTGFTMTILLWCYLAGPRIYRPARNALILINLVGLAVFFVLPVMPPRLLPDSGFVDTVAVDGYGTAHAGPVSMAPAQFAAMPSLHTAWAIWVMAIAMVLLARYPRLRWLSAIHPLSTAVVIVITANHYILDVVAGAVLAVVAIVLFGMHRPDGEVRFGGQVIRRRDRPEPMPPPDVNGSHDGCRPVAGPRSRASLLFSRRSR
ncbi:phosphatase PAP2 family protein [Spirillospora sp. CA-294931]|uniref:phosphatase PAP2 family protein n=1 Tax=Spirillospora sp. CA-294931 TaxID=3240042 RepID=UPI003D90D6A3